MVSVQLVEWLKNNVYLYTTDRGDKDLVLKHALEGCGNGSRLHRTATKNWALIQTLDATDIRNFSHSRRLRMSRFKGLQLL
jgi:hypothetical protein